jgi:hypothetical protein
MSENKLKQEIELPPTSKERKTLFEKKVESISSFRKFILLSEIWNRPLSERETGSF